MTQAGFLATSFPQSKLIYMVRDGRAVSHSLVSRKLEFPPFSNHDHSHNLKQWAKLATGYEVEREIFIEMMKPRMGSLCGLVGSDRCARVRYEDLVTNTEQILRQLTSWLGLAWDPVMLRHHEALELVETSQLETTVDQVIRPVYREALDKWRGNIPTETLEELNNDMNIAAALRHFGYDPLV